MMIADILEANGAYSKSDIQLFGSLIQIRNISRDELLIQPGEVCKAIYYNVSGAAYQFNYNTDGAENVIELHPESEWFSNHKSFISQQPAESYVKAYTEIKILELRIESLHYMVSESPAFLQLMKIFDQATSRIHFFDHRMTPLEKYLHVIKTRPNLLQTFPLKLIASYLKITPETLSRVREQISKGKILS